MQMRSAVRQTPSLSTQKRGRESKMQHLLKKELLKNVEKQLVIKQVQGINLQSGVLIAVERSAEISNWQKNSLEEVMTYEQKMLCDLIEVCIELKKQVSEWLLTTIWIPAKSGNIQVYSMSSLKINLQLFCYQFYCEGDPLKTD